jgi:hypothetical protein
MLEIPGEQIIHSAGGCDGDMQRVFRIACASFLCNKLRNIQFKFPAAVLSPLLCHLLIGGNQDVTTWTGSQVTDHTGFNVDFWLHVRMISR